MPTPASHHAAHRRARPAPAALLCVALLGLGTGGCVGTLGGTDGGDGAGAGGHDPGATGPGGSAASGGHSGTTSGPGGSGAGAPGGGGSPSSGGAGGGTETAPTGGAGGTPLACVASGPKDCSPTYDSSCPDGVVSVGNFTSQVAEAVQYVRDLPENAGWFDYSGQPACCPKVGTGTEADKIMFRDAVLERLNGYADLCAQADYGNHPHEISVKLNNACAEGYIVLTSQGVVRSPPKHSYNCVPANL